MRRRVESWRTRTVSILATCVLVILVLDASGPLAAGAAAGRVTALAVAPQDGTLWVGTAQGLFKSGDLGQTLAAVAVPATRVPADVTAVVVDPREPRAMYVAVAGDGVFKSQDGGRSWAAINSGLDGLDVRGLAVSPTDGRLHAQVLGKGLYRSFAGRGWARVDNGPAGTLHTLVSVNLSTGMGGIFLYAATDQGLVRGPD